MIYPVNNFSDWYDAQPYGNVTTYGFHEGADLNLKTGGNTDLGQELKSIAKGKIVYYHYSSHPTVNFGRHLVVKIEGPWGTRWVHYAHCQSEGFLNASQDVTEGQVIARLGNSGTAYAHCHFAVFKVDPATIGGIDVIARTREQLESWWEDPIAFINTWSQISAPQPIPEITLSTKIPQVLDNNGNPMEVQTIISKLSDNQRDINNLNAKIDSIRAIVG
jgi:murein DD-endopeptidase MepM/ murein hydrolase activator NlpD